jgi:hypothetical protein
MVVLKPSQRRQIVFWTGGILIAALPGLELARSNTQLLPVTFWGFLIATVLAALWNRSAAPLPRVFAIGMTLFALAVPAYASRVWMQEQRPNNLALIRNDAELVYNPRATIPEARRRVVTEQLLAYGISSSHFHGAYSALLNRAQVTHRFGVNYRGLPFIPRFRFISFPP